MEKWTCQKCAARHVCEDAIKQIPLIEASMPMLETELKADIKRLDFNNIEHGLANQEKNAI
jgi:hypothetical protein